MISLQQALKNNHALNRADIALIKCQRLPFVIGNGDKTVFVIFQYSFERLFVILFTVQGDAVYEWEGNEESLRNGECIRVPAAIDDLLLSTKTDAEILEVFIQN